MALWFRGQTGEMIHQYTDILTASQWQSNTQKTGYNTAGHCKQLQSQADESNTFDDPETSRHQNMRGLFTVVTGVFKPS